MTELGDGGGIYTLGWNPDSEISNNVVYDVKRNSIIDQPRPAAWGAPSFGLYFDQYSKFFSVNRNIIYDIAGPPLEARENSPYLNFNMASYTDQSWGQNWFGITPSDPSFPAGVAREAGPCTKPDFNCDNSINLLDLLHWRGLWAEGETGADVDGDNQHNLLDYLQILRGWLGS